jgi:periplasmic nitrate reductase NapE
MASMTKERRAMQPEKRRELAVFVFLTFILAPMLAIIIVAGYGFAVWMYQIIAGPPSV